MPRPWRDGQSNTLVLGSDSNGDFLRKGLVVADGYPVGKLHCPRDRAGGKRFQPTWMILHVAFEDRKDRIESGPRR